MNEGTSDIGTDLSLTGFRPKANSIGGWLGNDSSASRVSADMRTIIACFGLEGNASPGFEWPCKDSVPFAGKGMVRVPANSGMVSIRNYKPSQPQDRL